MKQLADKIKEYRLINELTQEQLAEKLFVSRQAVSKWEQGRGYPSMSVLEGISKLFNVTIDELIRCEEDEKLVLETAATYGWRLKNHFAKKILLFLVPFLLNFIYMWIYTVYISSNLGDFINLEAYQAYLETVYNYTSAAYFAMLIPLICVVLNIILYTLTVAGILKPRAFAVVFAILNAVILIIALLSVVAVCAREAVLGLSLGLIGGGLILLLSTVGVAAFFLLEMSKAAKEIQYLQPLQKGAAKKLPLFFVSAAFYILYMAVLLTVLYFSNAPNVRHNLLSTYGEIAVVDGLMIIIPAIITAFLYLLVLMKKMRLSVFIGLMLGINIPMLIVAFFYTLLPFLATGGLLTAIYISIGAFTAIIIYIIALIYCTFSAGRNLSLNLD